ncbi:MAG: MMPL family transporter [Myxococcota bacterium]
MSTRILRAAFGRILDLRGYVLLALGLVTALALTGLFPTGRLLVDFSLEALLVPDAESRERLLDFQVDFGDDEAIVAAVVVVPAGHTVFEAPTVAALDQLGAWLRERPEVDPTGVVTVADLALLSGPDIVPEALKGAPPAELAAIGQRLAAHRLYRGSLVSSDGRATLVVGPLAKSARAPDQRAPLINAWNERVAAALPLLPEGTELYPTGIPLVQETYGALALRDIILLVPLTVIVIAALLTLAFRRAYAVLGPLCAVGLATIWTLAMIQALGTPFNIVNSISGAVLLVVGVADGAHIVARHREEAAKTSDRREAILRTMAEMAPACFVTSATTAVGFASLVTAQLPVLRDFGVHLAIGVMLAYVVQLLLMPIILMSVSSPLLVPHPHSRTSRLLARVEVIVARRPRVIVAVAALAGIAGALGVANLRSNARALGELSPNHPVARGVALVETHLAGVLSHAVDVRGRESARTCRRAGDCGDGQECALRDPVHRAIEALREPVSLLTGVGDDPLWAALERRLRPAEGADLMIGDGPAPSDGLEGRCVESAADPRVVRALAAVEAWLARRADPLVARVTSVADALADTGLADLSDGVALRERIAILESSVPRVIGRWLTPDHTRTQLRIEARDVGIDAWRTLEPELARVIADTFRAAGLGERFDVALTGASTLAEKAMTGVLSDLAGSLAVDGITIFLFMLLLFRSFRLAFLAMIPNVLPLVLVLGAMGLLGIELRASTVVVFSVALGIAVDDTIHFVHRYREESHVDGEGRAAIIRTLHAVGHPVAWTTAILVAGFLVDAFSDLRAIADFGVLSAIVLVVALFVDLWLTPALLMTFQRRSRPPVVKTLSQRA